jgi:hypothetical protein
MPAIAAIRTLIHEYIHADIFRKLNTISPSSGELDFRNTFELYEGEHHEAMADLYINSMADALEKIHSAILINEANFISSNYSNQSLSDLYEALAWQGLKEHKVKAWLDKGTDTTRINNILLLHYNGLTKDCPQ